MGRKSGHISNFESNDLSENSQNIAHLHRNMQTKIKTRLSYSLVLCTSFRERYFVTDCHYMVSRKLAQRTNTWLIRDDFFYTYSWVNGLCFGYFKFFLSALCSIKNYSNPFLPMNRDFLTIRYLKGNCNDGFLLIFN